MQKLLCIDHGCISECLQSVEEAGEDASIRCVVDCVSIVMLL